MSATIWQEMESGRDSNPVVRRSNGYSSGNHGTPVLGMKGTSSNATVAPRVDVVRPRGMRPGAA
jgi:hypothetical protein